MIIDVIEHPQYKNRQYDILRSVIHVTKKNREGGRKGQREGSKTTRNRQAAIGTEGGEREKN